YAFIYNGTTFSSVIPNMPITPPQYVFYVRTDGGDDVNHSGLTNTAADAFKTIQGAITLLKQRYISSETITIRVADGYYAGGFSDSSRYVSAWNIIGNAATPANVIIDGSVLTASNPPSYYPQPAYPCAAYDAAVISIQGLTLRSYNEQIVCERGATM